MKTTNIFVKIGKFEDDDFTIRFQEEYQEINHISKRTAAYELVELVETYKIFKQQGESVGTYYEIL